MKKILSLALIIGLITVPVFAGSDAGAPGTDATASVTMTIPQYCTVTVNDGFIDMTDPITGTGSVSLTHSTEANFAATITPTIAGVAPGNTWTWGVLIGGAASKDIVASTGTPDTTTIDVSVSGVDLADSPITTTLVATVTVTITAT